MTWPWLTTCWPAPMAGRSVTVPPGARPGPGSWPTQGDGCWRRHGRAVDPGRACPPATIGQAPRAAPAPPADPSAADRDGDRPVGRALPRQTGLGPGCLAPVVTLATQAAEPHPGRLSLPADPPRITAVRRPHYQLKPAHRVS